MKRAVACFLCGLLAGCEVGPDYKPPTVNTPQQFGELQDAAQAPFSHAVAGEADLSQWWTQISDPELQRLIGRSLQSNLNLQAAVSRIRQAREQEIIAGASEWPQVNATGAGINLHSNGSPLASIMGGSGGQGQPPPPGSTNIRLYNLGFDATWELDVFGGVRRGVEAAQANTEAATWDMRDAEVSLTAEVANDYFTLRAAQARIGILRNEIQRQQGAFRLIAARLRAGFVTQLDVNQQRTQVETTAAQVPSLQADARAMEHAIAVLLGQQPEMLSAELDASAPLPSVPASLPVGLPSDLLRRRPDVRQAERKLAAATANIGVAVADLYPKFNLIGAASFTSNRIDNLLSASNFGTIGIGQITWPIFHGGQIRANIRVNEEQTQQAYLAYQQSVLQALQDAEDALTRLTNEQQRIVALQAAVASAQSSATIAERQYRAGLVTFVNVLTAQETLLNAQDQLMQSRQAFAQDLVSLYKALGGGWNASDETVRP
ncbi:MAG TPA: efflux transporter outer membrane subunit [Rhizomicrobium sp.]|jgi:NodT family efflux transporter outer membrane factor (OMF) lipoprotein